MDVAQSAPLSSPKPIAPVTGQPNKVASQALLCPLLCPPYPFFRVLWRCRREMRFCENLNIDGHFLHFSATASVRKTISRAVGREFKLPTRHQKLQHIAATTKQKLALPGQRGNS